MEIILLRVKDHARRKGSYCRDGDRQYPIFLKAEEQ